MLCKEQGITICGICAVYEIFVVQKVKRRDIPASKLLLKLHSFLSLNHIKSGSHQRHQAFDSNGSEWQNTVVSDIMVAKWSDASSCCFMLLDIGASFRPSTYNGLSTTRVHEVIYCCALEEWKVKMWKCVWVYDWARASTRNELSSSSSSCFKVTPSVSTKMYFSKSVKKKRRKFVFFVRTEKALSVERKAFRILVIAGQWHAWKCSSTGCCAAVILSVFLCFVWKTKKKISFLSFFEMICAVTEKEIRKVHRHSMTFSGSIIQQVWAFHRRDSSLTITLCQWICGFFFFPTTYVATGQWGRSSWLNRFMT